MAKNYTRDTRIYGEVELICIFRNFVFEAEKAGFYLTV